MNYLVIVLVSIFSAVFGAYSQYIVKTPVHIQVQSAVPAQNCTIHLKGVKNGELYGTLAGSGRLVVGTQILQTASLSAFSVPAGPLLTHIVTVEIPPNANFVASKRGSKLYTVTAAKVRSIPPANRVYFTTKAEGIAAGFK